MAESLGRGSRVIVHGRIRQRSFETKEGEKRTVMELDVDEIGPSLRFVTASLTRATPATGTEGSSAWTPEPVAAGAGDPPF